jgi:hypothetical protein
MYGMFPSLYPGNPLDTNRGRLIPTTSCDEYFAELALWYGVPAADLNLVLPNIGRFYTATSSTPPVGFMGSSALGLNRDPNRGRGLGRSTPSTGSRAGRRS